MNEYGTVSKNSSSTKIKMVSAKQNEATLMRLVRDWNLGPDKASEDPKANAEYWKKYAEVMGVTEAQGRRMLCANCEYYDNTPEMMEAMESVPMTRVDLDGGGRGFCNEFEFICHNLRTCQGWEKKEYKLPDDEKDEPLPLAKALEKLGK